MDQAILSAFSTSASGKAPASAKPAITSPALRSLLDHWLDRRGERAMPARDDLADDALSDALGELILFELSCVTCAKEEAAPAQLGGMVAGMTTPYHEAMRLGEPIYGRRALPDGEERLLLPLSRDGNRVDTILVGVQRKR